MGLLKYIGKIIMRALIQRVLSASVSVDGEIISEISKGALIFLGVKVGDKKEDLDYLVKNKWIKNF